MNPKNDLTPEEQLAKDEAKYNPKGIKPQGIPITPNSNKRDYNVITKRGINYIEIYNELIRDTSADDSVDSDIIPDRAVEVVQERPNNNRITRLSLTDAEAKKLKNDSRIKSCEYFQNVPVQPFKSLSGNFDRDDDESSEHQNWGLLRHTSSTNNYGTSSSDPGGTYDYVLDGTGVDIVVLDTGIEANHPEWEDANGVTRLKQIDWFDAAGVNGTWPNDMYEDESGHGTHVTSTVAGKYFGWAKNADIYSLRCIGAGVSTSDANGYGDSVYDLVRKWHVNKNNPSHSLWTGKFRPTIVNMSFGYQMFIRIDTDPDYAVSSYAGDMYGYKYRGTDYHNVRNLSDATAAGHLGFECARTLIYSSGNQYKGIDWQSDSNIAEMQEMIDAETATGPGIVISKAAGNKGNYCVPDGNADFDNELWFMYGANTYLPYECFRNDGDPDEMFCVGSIDATSYNSSLDRKKNYSRVGPGVNMWATGENIIGACSTSHEMSDYNVANYYYDSSYKQVKIGGTSMAAPQMCGMGALLLQAHPEWTPRQIVRWFKDNSISTLRDSTGSTATDHADEFSLIGGDNHVAYFKMHGKKPFGYSSS
jgi:subtilisin family serine protease|tara:strand:+ start:57 stop:1826 length:1770 start_codon:yes stop_codon:yes gene_type:complete